MLAKQTKLDFYENELVRQLLKGNVCKHVCKGRYLRVQGPPVVDLSLTEAKGAGLRGVTQPPQCHQAAFPMCHQLQPNVSRFRRSDAH